MFYFYPSTLLLFSMYSIVRIMFLIVHYYMTTITKQTHCQCYLLQKSESTTFYCDLIQYNPYSTIQCVNSKRAVIIPEPP